MIFKFCWNLGRAIQCLTHANVGLPDCEVSNESHRVFWGHIMNWGGQSKSCNVDTPKPPLGEELEEDIWDTGRVCTEDGGRELKLKFLGLQEHQSEMGGEQQVLGIRRKYLSVLMYIFRIRTDSIFTLCLWKLDSEMRFTSANICMAFFSSHVWSIVDKINCIQPKDVSLPCCSPSPHRLEITKRFKRHGRPFPEL